MLEFRKDMLALAKKYPDIVKVVITPNAWAKMCESFDKQLKEKPGHVAAHIKEKGGSMQFEQMLVEPVNEE